MRIVFFLLLGSICSLAMTELRILGPCGPGEIIIAISIFIHVFSSKKKMNHLNLILLMILFCYLIGYVLRVLVYFDLCVNIEILPIREIIAVMFGPFVASIICLDIYNKCDFVNVLFLYLKAFNIVAIFILLYTLSDLIYAYTAGIRFFGLSKNPNQLASIIIPVPFISLFFIRNKKYIINSILAISLSLILSFAVKSDALFYSMIFTLIFYFCSRFFWEKISYKLFFLILFFFCIPFILHSMSDYLHSSMDDGGQADVRFILWNNGFNAVLNSPLFGFGPGSFSGIYKPFQGAECHNSFLDLLTNVGFVGLSFYLLFLTNIILWFFRIKDKFLVCVIISYLIFSLFHNVLRHPTFWIVLIVFNKMIRINENKYNNTSL